MSPATAQSLDQQPASGKAWSSGGSSPASSSTPRKGPLPGQRRRGSTRVGGGPVGEPVILAPYYAIFDARGTGRRRGPECWKAWP
jgi:hypothetical protein